MKRYVFILKLSLIICVCGSFQSCDRIRALFNMPTSAELEQMWRDLEAEVAKEKADSAAAADMAAGNSVSRDSAGGFIPDSLSSVEGFVGKQNTPSEKYYVVLGRYRERANIDNMKRLLEERNERAVEIDRNDGSILVCAGGSSTIEEAKEALKRIEEYALSPDELWIFKNN